MATASRSCGSAARSARFAPERLKSEDQAALTAEIVRLMFGTALEPNAVTDAAAAAPEALSGKAMSEARPVVFEVRGLDVHDTAMSCAGIDLQRRRRRDPRHRRHRRQRPEAARRGAGRPAAHRRRGDPARRRADPEPRRRRAATARPPLRHRRPPLRGHGVEPARRHQFPAEADRRGAVLDGAASTGQRPSPTTHGRWCANTTCARRASRRRSGGSRAATSRRRCWRASFPARQGRDLRQADRRPRCAEHHRGAAAHPRRGRRRHRHHPDLDRSRRTAGAFRPHRGDVAAAGWSAP